MKHVVVGTAGHIDHGKTRLVKALTGVDTDRFKEEQERGITIDIGFAPLPLGPGLTVGFVDVPGHERFVKNMLAGIWGIDLVMLVVAADESIKPQTREHFDICSMLRVARGVIALTKIDLVDRELVELVSLEVREFVRGSFLEDAPLVPVSAKTGEGLDRLRSALADCAGRARAGRPAGILRLPVDRSFSVRGFGTVVTGTLVSGSIEDGGDAAVYPQGMTCRVRGLQVHNETVSSASAGQRTAVNLQGVDSSAVRRGDVLARPGELSPTSLLDVRLTLLPHAPAPLKDMARVRFHQGTSELLARVRLLGQEVLAPGGQSYAQVRLERPGCCLPGDRFVIRRYSPTVTIGGGVVLDAHPVKHRGAASADLLGRLARLETADARGALAIYLEGEPAGLAIADLAVRAGRTKEEVLELAGKKDAGRDILKTGESPSAALIDPVACAALEKAVAGELAAYHRANPLRPGMPREELRERCFSRAGTEVFRFVLSRMQAAGAVSSDREAIRLAAHKVTLSPGEERMMHDLDESFRAAGLNPPTQEEVAADLGMDPDRAGRMLHLLLVSGRLIRIKDGKLFHADAIEGLKTRLRELLPARRVIDIGSFKELTGTSRKNAIPLLEHLDSVKVTRRLGSDREILPPTGG